MSKLFALGFLGIVAFGAVSLFAAPEIAQAQAGLIPCGTGSPTAPGYVPCQLCHVFVLGNNIVKFLLVPSALNPIPIVLVIATFLFAWGGFVWVTAMGNPSRVQQGQQILLATVIGLLIVYGAWLFISLALDVFGVATFTGTGNWWEIDCSSPIVGGPPPPPPPPIPGCWALGAPCVMAPPGCCAPNVCDVGGTNTCIAPPPAGKQVFVTSTPFQGNLGGPIGADAICQGLADAAGIGGLRAWNAWVSKIGPPPDHAKDRIADHPYFRLDNTPVANGVADVQSGTILAPINQDEFRNTVIGGLGNPNSQVWTGTEDNGNVSGNECSGWMDSGGPPFGSRGTIGNATQIDSNWTDETSSPWCNSQYRLYCFEQ